MPRTGPSFTSKAHRDRKSVTAKGIKILDFKLSNFNLGEVSFGNIKHLWLVSDSIDRLQLSNEHEQPLDQWQYAEPVHTKQSAAAGGLAYLQIHEELGRQLRAGLGIRY